MQVDESTDISGKAQLLAFIRYVNNEKITEHFFCCKELTKTTTGQDIFDTLNTYLKEAGLSWKQCVGICTDGARLTFHSLLFHTVICFNAFFNAIQRISFSCRFHIRTRVQHIIFPVCYC